MPIPKNIKKINAILLTVTFALLSISLIIWTNYQIIGSWFGKNGPANLGSIEVSYVSMGKFLLGVGSPLSGAWAPFWYFGFPFHIFYTPLLPVLEAIANKLFNIPLWQSYRLITGLGFIFAPVAVFFLGWQMSKKVVGGLISAMLFSIGPTIFYFIIGSGEVISDRFSLEFLDPRRFTVLVRWGEGPHILSQLFVPLVGVFYFRLLQKFNVFDFLWSCLFLGLAALTNAIGLFTSVLLIASMSFVKFCQTQNEQSSLSDKQSILLLPVVGLVTLGLISFWYNLTFIGTFFKEAGTSGDILFSLFPWGWVGGVVVLFLFYLLFSKVIKDFAIGSALLWFFALFSIVAVYYLSAPADESYRRIELLPQALRYNIEVDLALAVLLGVIFGKVTQLIGRNKFAEVMTTFLGIVIAIALSFYIQPYIKIASEASGSVADVVNSSEIKVASWLNQHVNQDIGERVLAGGNYGFYLNWFTNIWQLRGGLYQASTHQWPDHVYYQLANGTDPEIANAWLKIANIRYAAISSPGSTEVYQDIKNAHRFESLAKPSFQENGDTIFEILLKRPSNAKPVNLASMKALQKPFKADDKKRLISYADWVEGSSNNQTEFKVIGNGSYRITGQIGEGEGILVQMSADSGWKAKDVLTGQNISIKPDLMGFFVLEPKPGKVDILLSRHISWQQWLGYLMTILTLIFTGWFLLLKKDKIFKDFSPIPAQNDDTSE